MRVYCNIICMSVVLWYVVCLVQFTEAGTLIDRERFKEQHANDLKDDRQSSVQRERASRQKRGRDDPDSGEDSDEDDDDDDAERVQAAIQQQQLAQEASEEESEERNDEDRRLRLRRDIEIKQDIDGIEAIDDIGESTVAPYDEESWELAITEIPGVESEQMASVAVSESEPSAISAVSSPNVTSVLIVIRDALKKVTANLPATSAQVTESAVHYFLLFEHFLQQAIEQVIEEGDEEDEDSTITSYEDNGTTETPGTVQENHKFDPWKQIYKLYPANRTSIEQSMQPVIVPTLENELIEKPTEVPSTKLSEGTESVHQV